MTEVCGVSGFRHSCFFRAGVFRHSNFRTNNVLPAVLALLGFVFLPIDATAGTGRLAGPDRIPGVRESGWRTAVYVGRFTETRFLQNLRGTIRFGNSHVGAVSLSRAWRPLWNERMVWEGEVQAAKHWGRQSHAEVNGAVLLRWLRFPWDPWVETSIAYGIGLSFASSTPRLERKRHDETSRDLLFMPFEIAAGLPQRRGEIFVRLHHRSGGYDIYRRGGGSNFVAAGWRWRAHPR